MSDYTYTDASGDALAFTSTLNSDGLVVNIRGSWTSVYIPNEDAPTVAAELLKAAGQESAIVAKSKSEVVERPFGQIRCGKVAVHADVDYASLLAAAADYIAIAEWTKDKLAEAQINADKEAEAEKKLQERRDALAAKWDQDGRGYTYANISFPAQHLIDRIIELEDGK